MEIAKITEILGIDEEEAERYAELALEKINVVGDSITIKPICPNEEGPPFGVVFRDEKGKEEWLSVTGNEIVVWDSIEDAQQDLFNLVLPTIGYHFQKKE